MASRTGVAAHRVRSHIRLLSTNRCVHHATSRVYMCRSETSMDRQPKSGCFARELKSKTESSLMLRDVDEEVAEQIWLLWTTCRRRG